MRFGKALALGMTLSLVATACDDTTSPDGDDVLQNDITTDQTLTDVESDPAVPDYVVSGVLDVSATLTIQPGVVIAFQEDAGMRVNDGGAIIALGTAASGIVLTGEVKTAGYWRGLLFRADDRTSELSHVTVEYGGRAPWAAMDVAANVSVDNDASLSLTNSVLEFSGGFGLAVNPRGQLPGFSTDSLTQNAVGPAHIPDVQIGSLDGASELEDNGTDYVFVYATIGMDAAMTVPAIDVPYRMEGSFEVNAPVTLSGAVSMRFTEGSSMRVNDGGALYALGTMEQPIVITGGEETPGFWRGILFRADDLTSELAHVTLEYAGREAWAGFDEAANISIDNDARLSLTNSSITDSNGYGLALNPRAELTAFSSNTFTEVTRTAFVPDKQMGAFDSETSYEWGVRVYATATGLDQEMTITNIYGSSRAERNFYLVGDFEVNAPITLEAGVNLAFDEGSGMRVNDGGALYAQGTEQDRIVLQGPLGDEQGTWMGVLFRADDLMSELDYIQFKDGGREAWPGIQDPANISVEAGAQVSVTNSLVQYSAGWGIWVDAGTAVLVEENNLYHANILGDVGTNP